MRKLAAIAVLLPILSFGQGLLKSYIMQEDTTRVCTLTVRSYENWDNPVDHTFKVATATYLLPGDYLVRYYLDTTWLHAEWIHITTKWMVMEKTIFPEPIPLHKAVFVLPKKGAVGTYIKMR
ncbi:MAG TPA: hypothetical protein PKJ19_05320 [Flavobacteriales bacterium]|nr:hypothetical protein [Flavobacteriales bacterium]